MDVILVGLPGSGKSAVGRRIAHRHGATFVDLDDVIEKTAGASIAEIFADRGEGEFRALERTAVEERRTRAATSSGWSRPGAERSSIRATGGGSIGAGCRSGSMRGRRSLPSDSADPPTSGR